jgi:hypothetical protein
MIMSTRRLTMDINNITSVLGYENSTAIAKEGKTAPKDAANAANNNGTAAAVYESGESEKVVKRDDETIKRMTADLEQRKAQLRNLVEQMLSKQSKTYTSLKELLTAVKDGEIQIDPEVQKQAEEDVSEDGYWGVEQTSERLVSFAKALSGSNPEYADKLIDAVKEGFKQAEEAWGGELPEISRKTLDATLKKLENWRDGKEA